MTAVESASEAHVRALDAADPPGTIYADGN
jgi:hypothetical protein